MASLLHLHLMMAAVAFGADGVLMTIKTVDESNGRTVPARLSVRASDGQWRWGLDPAGKPFDYAGLPRIWSGGIHELKLPAGAVEVIASRPFSWSAATARTEVTPGKRMELEIRLRPEAEFRALGWAGGDGHSHVVHGGDPYRPIDLQAAIRIARAEGLDWNSFGRYWTSLTEKQPTPGELAEITGRETDEWFLADWAEEQPADHLGHMAGFPLGVGAMYEQAVGINRYEGLQRAERAGAALPPGTC